MQRLRVAGREGDRVASDVPALDLEKLAAPCIREQPGPDCGLCDGRAERRALFYLLDREEYLALVVHYVK